MGDHSGSRGKVRSVSSSSRLFAESRPSPTESKNWAKAEKAACKIIRKVQPTYVSEERRRGVFDYIKGLIETNLGAEVFSYGSVPLKTYLPDGDIDLTVFGGANIESSLAENMKSVLEAEERNMTAEFIVKDVQLISAEVKLVRCSVQDMVVDVSFNQIGGLCSLCFLEQVDRLIGKDHLFKRSIILIKAWCYYESRILGARHRLISTYALEILVLYIIQLFHSKLEGPLSVLWKFLDYFGNFDWEAYGISLNGPVRLSSLPEISVEMPEDSNKDLLLNGDILISCVNMFSFPSRSDDKNSHGFQRKHLNIIDPLKLTNNLGRSVSQGNFFRIRHAFSYGARKLAQILLQPEDSIASELHKFFSDTMARHGGGLRHDVQGSFPRLTCNRPISSMPVVNHVGNRGSASNVHKYEASVAPKSFNHVRGSETPESSNSLIDLSGDYSSYLQWLRHGRERCEPAVSSHSMHMTCSPTISNQNNNPRDNVLPPPNFMQNMLPHQLFHPSSAAPPMLPKRAPCIPFEWREMHYLLENQLLESCRSPRGRNQVPLQSSNRSSPHANYSSIQPEGVTECGSVGNVSGTQASVREQRVASSFPSTSTRAQQSQLVHSSDQDSTRSGPAYHLKDEIDFPPL